MSDHYDRYNGMEKLLGTNLAEVGTDLISRAEAIDTLTEYGNGRAVFISVGEAVIRIEQLPPIQPVNCSEFPNNSDTISRQAAIDVVVFECGEWMGLAREISKQLRQLPSTQPENIRCKDCKHWIPYDWMFSEVWRSKNMADYPEDEIGCAWCDMAMKANDFCSRAERREVTT